MNETDQMTKSKPVLDADDTSRDELLDQALAAVCEEVPPGGSEQGAAARVRRSLGLPAGPAGNLTDYGSLIPAYLVGRLNDAQRLLFEDEVRTSIPLRRALAAARGEGGGNQATPIVQSAADPRPERGSARKDRRWFYAIAAGVAVAVGAVLILPILDEPAMRLARVDTVEGMSLRQVGGQWVPLVQDDWIEDGQRLATKQNGTALLQFEDGSRVEVAPRSLLLLTGGRGGSRLRIDHGDVIVQVTPQGDGTFDIATDDLVVEVVGTTLGVSHGTKGSRVAVIEGEVEVSHGGKTTSLQAGDQYGTRKTTATALEETVGWSREAERYVEILQAYADLQRDIEAALTVDSRHSTRLLDLVPAQTSVYVAVPNAPATIAEAYDAVEAFHDRLRASQFPPHESTAMVKEMVGWLGELGEHLGPETVLALHWEDSDSPVLLLLAEAREGLHAVIADKLREVGQTVGSEDIGVEIVDAPEEAQEGRLAIWLTGGLFAATASPATFVELRATLQGAPNRFREGALYARLAEVYERGAEYVAGADLTRLGLDEFANPLLDFRGAQTAIAEHRLDEELALAALEVRFDTDNPDRVPLLDQPGPMGALKFFSPDATLAGALVLPDSKKLKAVVDAWLADLRPAYADQPAASEFVEGLADIVGGEIAVALDGPLLPQPSWKAVVEVYDQARLQTMVETSAGLLQLAVGDDELGLEVVEGTAPSEPVYRLSAGGIAVYYAFIDGYLVLAGNRTVLDRARGTYESGVTLLDGGRFQKLLPLDSYLDFSAVTYARLDDSLLLPLLDVATRGSDGPRNQLLNGLREILAGAAMFGVYNEPDRIRLVLNGSEIAPFYGLPLLPALGVDASDSAIRWDVDISVDPDGEQGDGT
ncbi:MAG: FecR family protein [Gammaproteobacteria bacterium]|nr:FecR family protein [Gammaproteobacteria bacterium]